MTSIAAFAMCAATACSKSGARPDRNYPVDVANPAYLQRGPLVLFDEAHHNLHTARGTYAPFVHLIENDGYTVRRNREAFTKAGLQGAQVLVISNAMGNNERNDDAAFTEAECDDVAEFVRQGGSLLLITDHYPMGDAAQNLAARFGVQMSRGETDDSTSYEKQFDPSNIVYTSFGRHPIINGRTGAERIRRVLTFTGQSLSVPPGATALLPLGPHAIDLSARPRVERNGGDVRVIVEFGDAVSAAGRAQAVALSHGRGRVVMLAEAAMASAQLSAHDKSPFGMNVTGYDDRQFILNTMHWLTGALPAR